MTSSFIFDSRLEPRIVDPINCRFPSIIYPFVGQGDKFRLFEQFRTWSSPNFQHRYKIICCFRPSTFINDLKMIHKENQTTEPLHMIDLSFLIVVHDEKKKTLHFGLPSTLLHSFRVDPSTDALSWGPPANADDFEWDACYMLPPRMVIQILCSLVARSNKVFCPSSTRALAAFHRTLNLSEKPLTVELAKDVWFPFAPCFEHWSGSLDARDYLDGPAMYPPFVFTTEINVHPNFNTLMLTKMMVCKVSTQKSRPHARTGPWASSIHLLKSEDYQVISAFYSSEGLRKALQAIQAKEGQTMSIHEVNLRFLIAFYDHKHKTLGLALPAVLLNPFYCDNTGYINFLEPIDVNDVAWHEFYVLPPQLEVQVIASLFINYHNQGDRADQMHALYAIFHSSKDDLDNKVIELADEIYFPLAPTTVRTANWYFALLTRDYIPSNFIQFFNFNKRFMELSINEEILASNRRPEGSQIPWIIMPSKIDLLRAKVISPKYFYKVLNSNEPFQLQHRYIVVSTFRPNTLGRDLKQIRAEGGLTQPLSEVDLSFFVAILNTSLNTYHFALPAMLLTPYQCTENDDICTFIEPLEKNLFAWYEFYILPPRMAIQILGSLLLRSKCPTEDDAGTGMMEVCNDLLINRSLIHLAIGVFFPSIPMTYSSHQLSNICLNSEDYLDGPAIAAPSRPPWNDLRVQFQIFCSPSYGNADEWIKQLPLKISLLEKIAMASLINAMKLNYTISSDNAVKVNEEKVDLTHRYRIISTFYQENLTQRLKAIQSRDGMTKPLKEVDLSFLLGIQDVHTKLLHLALPTVIINRFTLRINEEESPSGEFVDYQFHGPSNVREMVWHECYILPPKLALQILCSFLLPSELDPDMNFIANSIKKRSSCRLNNETWFQLPTILRFEGKINRFKFTNDDYLSQAHITSSSSSSFSSFSSFSSSFSSSSSSSSSSPITRCELCNRECGNSSNLLAHMKGNEHKTNLAKQQQKQQINDQ